MDDLAKFIERQVLKYGYKKVVFWPTSLLSLVTAILIGLRQYFAVLSGLLLIAYLASMVVVVIYARRQTIVENRLMREVLVQHARRVTAAHADDPEYFEILSWHETLKIGKNGDTIFLRKFRLRVGPHEMDSFATSCTANEPCARRGDVTVVARLLQANGEEGVRRPTVEDWESDSKVKVVVFFNTPVKAGEEVGVSMTWFWPQYSRLLIEGKTEKNWWRLTRPCGELTSKIVIQESAGIRGQVRANALSGSPEPETVQDGNDWVITFSHNQTELRSEFGYEVEVSPN